MTTSEAKVANMENAIFEKIQEKIQACDPLEAHDLIRNVAARLEDLEADIYCAARDFIYK